MSEDCAQLTTVGVYLLDALERDERDALTGHLAQCPQCRSEVEDLTPVVRLLALARAGLPAQLHAMHRTEAADE